jgi:hypothetical protein
VIVVFLLAAACGGGGRGIDPDSLGSCGEVADAAVVVLQDSIDAMDRAASGAEPDAADIAALEESGRELEDRAAALGCGDAQMAELLADRADRLEAESVLGQSIIEGLRAGEGGFFADG